MHLFEDLVITEVVDADNQPVPPGEYGAKVLVTVLFSRTLPLIRYEMSDSLQVGDRSRLPVWPPVRADHRNPGTRTRITDFPDRQRSGSGRATDCLPSRHGRRPSGGLADPTDRRRTGGSTCPAAEVDPSMLAGDIRSALRPKESSRLRCTSMKSWPSPARR